MAKGFDRIVKEKLENLMVPGASDWALFSAFLDIELPVSDQDVDLDFDIDTAIGDYSDTMQSPQWDLFESRLDEFNAIEDQSFDNEIKSTLNESAFPWNESHWGLMSEKLDSFNDRPRILLLKVMEVAAVLLVLLQLPGIYNTVKTTIDHNQPFDQSELNVPSDDLHKFSELEKSINPSDLTVGEESVLPDKKSNPPIKIAPSDSSSDPTYRSKEYIVSDRARHIKVDRLKSKKHFVVLDQFTGDQQSSLITREPMSLIEMPSIRIKNSSIPRGVLKRLPSLNSKNISVASVPMDTILSGVASVSVLRPKLQSSLETGVFADVTEASIKDRFRDKSFEELLINPGMYFKYKLQYGKVFGALGADYVEMEYAGANKDNSITMVSLPLELGYNFVNLSSFRMYISGGIAGRFIPKAEYSENTFNPTSQYNQNQQVTQKENKSIDYGGLLKNGPFEINSYLSGRISIGMDANINRNVSVNLRLTHDAWLKGKGIGYNFDTFKSSQLALGMNYHF